ncbi:MAG TPA: tetratricopeptide repeat protein [Verrucomicrobiota bacterium]|nr:tetratricopeptide repeat protein [Verrucomicrobiota bacterium]
MTQYSSTRQQTAVATVLPWLLGAAALIVYLITINPWISLLNMPQVAKVSGWMWTPDLFNPAYYLVTLPLHLLPVRWVPLGLNVFSAVCAALVLAQLARCVALLPHDRTHAQRQREGSEHSTLSIPLAWLPPMLAVLLCGLQLTFWEHATNGTGEMFDMLLFSYVARSLLEFRIDDRDPRLFRAALVMGIGMTNNYAMVAFLPVFIASVVWLKGFGFFNLGFLTRMALCGLAGLLLYLLLPLVAALSSAADVGFWHVLKANLGSQKNVLVLFPKKTLVALALTSLLPVLLLSLRWPSRFGDSSQLGSAIATGMFHLTHAFLLLACIWIAFDPPVSPRNRGMGLPFLTLYFLGALSVGYFAGYFLLVFTSKFGRTRVFSPALQNAERIAISVLFGLLLIVAVGLPARNLPQIRLTNGSIVKNFAASLAAGLPGGGVVLSDDWRRLLLVESWVARSAQDKEYLFLDTQSLRWPPYHVHLSKKYPGQWQPPEKDSEIEMFDAPTLMGQITKLSTNKPLYYLHPSFGYYFEIFHPEARGLVFEMKRFQPGRLLPPPPSDENIALNEKFWGEAAENALASIAAATEQKTPEQKDSWLQTVFKRLYLKPEINAQTRQIGMFYSRALNYWGVEMQKLGRLDEAASHFKLAMRLNPGNVVAELNLAANQNLKTGNTQPVAVTQSIEHALGKYRSLEQVLNDNGPYDEPSLAYAQAWVFMQGKLYREAAQWLNRVRDFATNDIPARLALAQISLMANDVDFAAEISQEIRSNPERFPLNSTNRADLLVVDAAILFARTNLSDAESLIDNAIQKEPKNDHLLSNVASLHLQRRDLTNALEIIGLRLKLNPTNTAAMINKAYIEIQQGRLDDAIATLNRAVELEPANHMARMNRAIAHLRAEHLDEAKADYEILDISYPNQFQILYGLGEIAWRQKDTNAAIKYYENYLTNSPPKTIEAKSVAERLDQLKGVKKD